jgi:chemotaxis protein MotB
MNLSRERAESVKAHLVEKFRLNPSRVKTQGFGYSRPKFANDTDENRLKNRRVEIMFVENPESRDTR